MTLYAATCLFNAGHQIPFKYLILSTSSIRLTIALQIIYTNIHMKTVTYNSFGDDLFFNCCHSVSFLFYTSMVTSCYPLKYLCQKCTAVHGNYSCNEEKESTRGKNLPTVFQCFSLLIIIIKEWTIFFAPAYYLKYKALLILYMYKYTGTL